MIKECDNEIEGKKEKCDDDDDDAKEGGEVGEMKTEIEGEDAMLKEEIPEVEISEE
jgi:hypothetical protein